MTSGPCSTTGSTGPGDTALLEVAGLDAAQLARRPVPPSSLSLLGVLRHLTEVEAHRLREVLHGQDVDDLSCTPAGPDGDVEDATAATAGADVAAYRAELVRTRAAAAGWPAWTDP